MTARPHLATTNPERILVERIRNAQLLYRLSTADETTKDLALSILVEDALREYDSNVEDESRGEASDRADMEQSAEWFCD